MFLLIIVEGYIHTPPSIQFQCDSMIALTSSVQNVNFQWQREEKAKRRALRFFLLELFLLRASQGKFTRASTAVFRDQAEGLSSLLAHLGIPHVTCRDLFHASTTAHLPGLMLLCWLHALLVSALLGRDTETVKSIPHL